jgi:molybdopterin/thiamine biosynthesis adenylyltransferase
MPVDPLSPIFQRQRVLAEFGVPAQERLARAHVLVIGAGGLASTLLPVLAAAGVGTLTIVDDDTVAESICTGRRCTRRVTSAAASCLGRHEARGACS